MLVTKLIVSIIILSMITSFSGLVHSAICGGATQCNCGDALTYSQVMWYNLTNCSTHGIVVGVNSITLDCNGHLIDGDGTGGADNGIWISNKQYVTIKNCELSDFGYGIHFESSSKNGLMVNNTAHNNVNGIRLWAIREGNIDNHNHSIRYNYLYNNTDGIGVDNSHNNYIENNTVVNNTRGINIGFESQNNTAKNNAVNFNTYGFYFHVTPRNNSITGNSIIENKQIGAYIFSTSFNTTFWNNIFVDNVVNAKEESGIRWNHWNMSNTGNCWSDFAANEGYPNNYTISGPGDGVDFRPRACYMSINRVNPVQVVENVDLVKDKRTLVRTEIISSRNETTTINVSIYFNGTFVHSNKTTINAGETKNVSIFFMPNISGSNLPIKAEVEANFSGAGNKTSKTVTRNVNTTRTFHVGFVPVAGPTQFKSSMDGSVEFINRTYPLADNGLVVSNFSGFDPVLIDLPFPLNLLSSKKSQLLIQVRLNSILSDNGFTERSVGILPEGWIEENIGDEDSVGFADYDYLRKTTLGSLVIEDIPARSIGAHELGHTYGLCDEYNSTIWKEQDTAFFGLVDDLCPNGDMDKDDELDLACLIAPNIGIDGCPSFDVLSELVPWDSGSNFLNFMGSGESQNKRWVTNETYKYLFDQFDHSTPENASSRLVVTGVYNKSNGQTFFGNFYILDAGLVDNQSDFTKGDFFLETKNVSGNSLFNLSFNLSFAIHSIGGDTEQINVTPFIFVVPFNETLEKIRFSENGTLKQERNRTDNTPSISITYPIGGESFNNEINVTWTASDSDNDNLSYAILLSFDNGTTYNALKVDHTNTTFIINATRVSDCGQCKVKVLATDGVNTNSTETEPFSMDNNLKVEEFKVVHKNDKERVFRIKLNNTLKTNITNISWTFDSGEDIKQSIFDFNLQSKEEIILHIFHNYTTIGTFNVTATFISDILIESDVIEIEVS